MFGVFCDKRDELQCRKWLVENAGKFPVLVVPVDDRSNQLVEEVLHQFLPYIRIHRDPAILDICENVVSFRYDEGYVKMFKDKIFILDYLSLNKTEELIDGIK